MTPLGSVLNNRFLRRVPLPVLAVLVGLVCGLLTWIAMEQVQHKALGGIFQQQVGAQMERRARASLVGFGQYVGHYITATRLLANHRRMFTYLDPLSWFADEEANPRYHDRFPPWLPPRVFQSLKIYPSHVLLLDPRGRTREVYQRGGVELPRELEPIDEIFLDESQVYPVLTELGGEPFLLVSAAVSDAAGELMGYLMLVVPIDADFMGASRQRLSSSETIVALVDGDEETILASSDPGKIIVGATLERMKKDYMVTEQSFSDYTSADLNIQYATFLPRAPIHAAEQEIMSLERRQRLITASVFIAVFTLLMFLISLRLNGILRRVSEFSRTALGYSHPVIKDANPLFMLDDWIRKFINVVSEMRDDMKVQHEAEIRNREALKTAILETSLDSIITIEASGEIIEFNPTAEKVLGYARDQALGEKLPLLIIAEADRDRFLQLLNKCLFDDKRAVGEKRMEIEVLREDGTQISMETAIMPILLDNRIVFTVYLHDVSRRQQAEREVISLAKLASESPNPVLRVNHRGVIIYANTSSRPLLDYWNCAPAQTLPEYWRRRVADSLDHEQQEEAELISDGRIYTLLLVPILEFDYVNIYGRDITEVRRAEQQTRQHQAELVHVCRLSTMGEMSTGLAHELNQPLAAIVNFSSGCMRRLRTAQVAEHDLIDALGQISAQAERAGEIIRRLRGLVSKQPPIRSEVDLNDIVHEVCSFVEFEVRKLGVETRLRISNRKLLVRVDYVQIEQVLLNLLRNAMDALQETAQKDRRLVMRTSVKGPDQIQISVRDSGAGIPGELMEQLFDPFFTTKEGGMGMGLAISQTIINDHGGKIRAISRPGGGTLFRIVLPRYPGAGQESARGFPASDNPRSVQS